METLILLKRELKAEHKAGKITMQEYNDRKRLLIRDYLDQNAKTIEKNVF